MEFKSIIHVLLVILAIINILYGIWIHRVGDKFSKEEWELTATIYSWLFTIAIVVLTVTLHGV